MGIDKDLIDKDLIDKNLFCSCEMTDGTLFLIAEVAEIKLGDYVICSDGMVREIMLKHPYSETVCGFIVMPVDKEVYLAICNMSARCMVYMETKVDPNFRVKTRAVGNNTIN